MQTEIEAWQVLAFFAGVWMLEYLIPAYFYDFFIEPDSDHQAYNVFSNYSVIEISLKVILYVLIICSIAGIIGIRLIPLFVAVISSMTIYKLLKSWRQR